MKIPPAFPFSTIQFLFINYMGFAKGKKREILDLIKVYIFIVVNHF
jgi:hypothetical protein